MENTTWACFDCHETYRRSTANDEIVPCAKCNKHCMNIGFEINIPKKNDTKSWDKLYIKLKKQERDRNEASIKESVRLKHDIEQNELRLDIIESSKDNKTALKTINKQLKKRAYTGENKPNK